MTAAHLFKRYGRGRCGGPAACASYTVEASCVMAMVLLSLAMLIRTAYGRCRQETGIMKLHHTVEMLRCREDETDWDFSSGAWTGQAERDAGQVSGSAYGEDWKKEITVQLREPEQMMRMLTVFDGLTGRAETSEGAVAEGGDGDGGE